MQSKTTQEAEEFIASQCIQRPSETVKRVSIEPTDFKDKRCSEVFRVVCELVEKGEKEIDTVGLAELTGVDSGFIGDLLNICPNAFTPEIWSNHVKDASYRRRIRSILDTYSGDDGRPEEIIEGVTSALSAAFEPRSKGDDNASTVMHETVDDIEKTYEAKSAVGIQTGVKSLQENMGGLPTSVLTIIGAEASVGKTAFSLDMALAGAESGHSCDYYSLEDERKNVGRRLISKVSGVPLQLLRTCRLSNQDFMEISKAANYVSSLPLRIYDKGYLSAEQFVFDLRRNARQNRTEVVYVDYLQLLRLSDSKASRNDEIDKILFMLKMAAKDLGLAVVILSQLKRRDRDSSDTKPRKERLRDSGTIEQHAHVILMVHRKPNDTRALLLIEKNKEGPLGEIDMEFVEECAMYREVE